ncbi:RHS repeat-associated core domain-containing protein [Reichenbachiella agarivorans]|uniref:RHS repeat-associated core domain-containing protein n=1 Tax=Reichenbachiella agarivorans TaxID=2979464 RepID=A0ABY6CRJ4_9BACT|nr:RHS repeat-associated core domain-containing protein [Reichenbachiella agarivorans]UXP33108.1 RHS repeat-associated core domain-containing protein [Reichenbachiella agarivorans]
MTEAAAEDGTDVDHEHLSHSITIAEAGYVYIYLSNENGTTDPIDVFFDDFKVVQQHTPIVQKDDYYPFGLTFNSYSSGIENLFKFNGKEELEETGWYDYGARMLDPSLARWFNIDPLADRYKNLSPYNYVANNPLKYVDPDGKEIRFADNKSTNLLFKMRVVANMAASFVLSKKARSNIKTLMGKDANLHVIQNNSGRKSKVVPAGLEKWENDRPEPPKVEFNENGDMVFPEGDGQKEIDEWRGNKPANNHNNGEGDGTLIRLDLDQMKDFQKKGDIINVGTGIDHEISHAVAIEKGKAGKTAPEEEQRAVNETDVIRTEKNRFRIFNKIEKRDTYDRTY